MLRQIIVLAPAPTMSDKHAPGIRKSTDLQDPMRVGTVEGRAIGHAPTHWGSGAHRRRSRRRRDSRTTVP